MHSENDMTMIIKRVVVWLLCQVKLFFSGGKKKLFSEMGFESEASSRVKLVREYISVDFVCINNSKKSTEVWSLSPGH